MECYDETTVLTKCVVPTLNFADIRFHIHQRLNSTSESKHTATLLPYKLCIRASTTSSMSATMLIPFSVNVLTKAVSLTKNRFINDINAHSVYESCLYISHG
jgi:hypothetical protein